MKILLSPAKSLDFKSDLPITNVSDACFLNEAKHLNSILREKSPSELSNLMNISTKLGELNYERNKSWSIQFSPKNARQAIYAFNGGVYKGLDSYTIQKSNTDFLQRSVRIISGLYGLLKPLDLIQPYRLEMGTKLAFDTNKNLYDFWTKKITNQLNNEISANEPVINLASNEYFKAIDSKVINAEIFKVSFKQLKNGDYKTIAIFSKIARGMMTRFIVDNQLTSVNDIKLFNKDRYMFDNYLSSENEFVFTR